MKCLYLFSLLIFWSASYVVAQDSLFAKRDSAIRLKDKYLLSNRGYHKYINRAFSQVAVGPTNGANLANYATFEPIGGSFSFNGFTPINAGKDTGSRVSYLNFAVKGGIDGNNVGALFSNSKLNTNVTVSLRYHFGLNKSSITYDETVKFGINQGKDKLMRQHLGEIDVLAREIPDLNARLTDNEAKVISLSEKRDKEDASLRATRILSAAASDGKFADSLQHISQRISKLNDQLTAQQIIVDSLRSRRDWFQLGFVKKNTALGHIEAAMDDLDEKYLNKKDDLEMNAKISRIHFGWFSLNLDFNKQKYYTFFDSLTFDNQIEKKVLDAFNLGVSYNFFWQDVQNGKIFYLNSGLSRIKTNNTSDLSATDIVDTRTLSGTDTKRVITTKYSAFTSPIVEFIQWQTYANVYYMFGKQNVSGVHLFPELNFRDTGKQVANIGVGYVISFNDAKKAKSIVNAEAYVKFTDIGNALSEEPGFYKRNEIGISFGIPFNYIISAAK